MKVNLTFKEKRDDFELRFLWLVLAEVLVFLHDLRHAVDALREAVPFLRDEKRVAITRSVARVQV